MANVKNDSIATKNVVTVTGEVKENKLTIDKEKIMGSLVVQYGDKPQDQAEVKVFINRYKDEKDKDGNKTGSKVENKNYEKIKDLNDNLVSKANATEEKPATIVRISGKEPFAPSVRLNEFVNENNGEIVSNVELSLGFGNIYAGDVPKEQFKGEFDMVVYLSKNPKKQDKDGKEILLVEGLYIDYKGAVKPVEFVVEDEELIEGIEECSKGDTVNFWGSCQVAQVTEIKEKKSGFGGKAKTDIKIFTQRQLLIEGGDPIDEDSKEAIDSDFIKKALVERETFLEELKNKKTESKPKGKGGFGGDGGKKSKEIPF